MTCDCECCDHACAEKDAQLTDLDAEFKALTVNAVAANARAEAAEAALVAVRQERDTARADLETWQIAIANPARQLAAIRGKLAAAEQREAEKDRTIRAFENGSEAAALRGIDMRTRLDAAEAHATALREAIEAAVVKSFEKGYGPLSRMLHMRDALNTALASPLPAAPAPSAAEEPK